MPAGRSWASPISAAKSTGFWRIPNNGADNRERAVRGTTRNVDVRIRTPTQAAIPTAQQHAFFEWLGRISTGLDLDNPAWLREVSLHYLSRREPKTDWHAHHGQVDVIRRSRRLESGWEIDNGRLFLAPVLFDELLLVQYLVSRSHRAGGLTLEGRYTLPELYGRLRNSGYLRAVGVSAQNPADALEQLVIHLGGGDAAVKFYHLVDRRDFLGKVKSLKLMTPPKPKAQSGNV